MLFLMYGLVYMRFMLVLFCYCYPSSAWYQDES